MCLRGRASRSAEALGTGRTHLQAARGLSGPERARKRVLQRLLQERH